MTTHAFAFYRMPYQTAVHVVRQTGTTGADTDARRLLEGGSGFVIAPFAVSDACPLLLIRPNDEMMLKPEGADDVLRPWCDEAIGCSVATGCAGERMTRDDYHRVFTCFHGQVCSGALEKIVLARQEVVPSSDRHPVALFLQACLLYPRMFIALFYTPPSGLWLTATPELLLERDSQAWHTVALAGTIRYEEGETPRWSDKNIGEQRIVADYVARLLHEYSDEVEQSEPQTVRAGHLIHLRTDFHFTLSDPSSVNSLVRALHPTPAVCGLPKDEALRLISNEEPFDRRYYSGYAGPWQLQTGSHLFIALRCMTREYGGWRLFAGGGIVPGSEEESEWQETEDKLLTMRRLLYVQQ